MIIWFNTQSPRSQSFFGSFPTLGLDWRGKSTKKWAWRGENYLMHHSQLVETTNQWTPHVDCFNHYMRYNFHPIILGSYTSPQFANLSTCDWITLLTHGTTTSTWWKVIQSSLDTCISYNKVCDKVYALKLFDLHYKIYRQIMGAWQYPF